MRSKNELWIGYAVAVICLLVGVFCYSILPAKPPESPLRVMFSGMGGNVLFHHQTHIADYGLACKDCHHSVIGSPTDTPDSCESCHLKESVYTPALGKNGVFDHPAHSEDYGLNCSDCHHTYAEGDSGEPEACGTCHNPESEDGSMLGRVDAFHKQCIECHEASGVTPGGSDCAECHKPRPRKDAFHDQCMNCHEDSGAGPGRADCTTCHGY